MIAFFDIRRMVPLVILGTCLVLLGLMSVDLSLALLVPLAFLGFYIIFNPGQGVLVCWVLMTIIPALEVVAPSILIKGFEQGLLPILILMLLLQAVLERRSFRLGRWIDLPVLLFVVIIIASAIANRVPIKYVVFFALTYLKPIALLYLGAAWLKPKHVKTFGYCVIWIVALQILFNLAYLAGINKIPLMLRKIDVDLAVGTLCDAHQVAYVMMIGIFLMIAHINRTKQTHMILLYVATITVLMLQFVLCFAVHAYAFLLAGLLIQFTLFFRKRLQATLRYILPAALLGVLMYQLFILAPGKETTSDILDRAVMERRIRHTFEGPKGVVYEHVFLKSGDYMPYPSLGAGPGNYTSNIALMHGRPMTFLGHFMQLQRHIYQGRIATGSLLSTPTSGFITVFRGARASGVCVILVALLLWGGTCVPADQGRGL